MAPTRRFTRSSAGTSPSKSPSRKSVSVSPKKGTRPTRIDKHQPRIDEYKPASKTAPTRRAKKDIMKNIAEDEDEVVEIAQVVNVNIGIDEKTPYQTPISSAASSPITPKTGVSSSSSNVSIASPSSSGASSPFLSGSWSRGTSGYALKELDLSFFSIQSAFSSSSPASSTASKASFQTHTFDPFSKSEEKDNQVLKNFDIECIYGPCCGISRRERYQRAIRYSIDPAPSPIILQILDKKRAEKEKNYQEKWETCMWDKYGLKVALKLRGCR